jgi:hypothetical protein
MCPANPVSGVESESQSSSPKPSQDSAADLLQSLVQSNLRLAVSNQQLAEAVREMIQYLQQQWEMDQGHDDADLTIPMSNKR